MLHIGGIYEVAIRVKDLARAEAFYKETLGLQEGLRVTQRNLLFLRAGGNAGMIVLQWTLVRTIWGSGWAARHATNDELEVCRTDDGYQYRGVYRMAQKRGALAL